MKPVHVEDLMTRKVVSLQSDHSIHLAASVMQWKHIRHLPVLEGEVLVGLVTHRDLLKAQAALLAEPYDPRHDRAMSVPVRRIMQTNVWTVGPRTPALEAARIMRDHKFGCLPVIDGYRLAGIVTEADFLGYLIDALSARREREDTDRIAVR